MQGWQKEVLKMTEGQTVPEVFRVQYSGIKTSFNWNEPYKKMNKKLEESFKLWCSAIVESEISPELKVDQLLKLSINLHESQVKLDGYLKVSHADVAIIEGLHDTLIDEYNHDAESVTIKNSRELTNKLYKVLGY